MSCGDGQRLPVEIFDLIVDSIQDINGGRPRSALYACSLVSRAFSRRARRNIFREVKLYTWRKNSISQVNTFFELLTWEPSNAGAAGGILRIASIVKYFRFNYSEPQTSEVAIDDVVISILQALRRQNLGIEYFGFDFQGIWRDYRIKGSFPHTLLLGSAVRHLHPDSTKSEDMAESMEHLSASRRSNSKDLAICSQVESLEIDGPDESHLALLCGGTGTLTLGQFTRLHKLTVTMYFFEDDYKRIAPLLSRAEGTLEDVKIIYGDDMDRPISPPATVDLGGMKRLKNLTLDSFEEDVGTVLHDYNLLLGRLTAPATLETLNLHVPLDIHGKDHLTALAPLFQSLGASSNSNVWAALNNILSAPFAFTGLRQLTIYVQFLQHFGHDSLRSDTTFRDLVKTFISLSLPFFPGLMVSQSLLLTSQCKVVAKTFVAGEYVSKDILANTMSQIP